MYGTLAKLSLAEGSKEELKALLTGYEDARPNVKGFKISALLEPDEDPNTLYLVAIFEDEETYRANAADPAQDDWYQNMRKHLKSDPEWHDSNITVVER